MNDEISFNLFGEGGFINPTRWSHTQRNEERFLVPLYDQRTGTFTQKQTAEFDGGWRWFDTYSYEADALTIYNVKLDKRAFWILTRIDMVDTVLTPELLLYWVKSMVLVEHRYYTTKNWLEDHIRALARKVMIEIRKEIHGDDQSHLHSIYK